jgi:hypothetical protein
MVQFKFYSYFLPNPPVITSLPIAPETYVFIQLFLYNKGCPEIRRLEFNNEIRIEIFLSEDSLSIIAKYLRFLRKA